MSAPSTSLHHVHLMTADLSGCIGFWQRHFGAEIVADLDFSGARNVFLKVGTGRIHLYEQPPNHRGPVNHLGVLVDDIEQARKRLLADGLSVRTVKTDPDSDAAHCMAEGPDGVLIELFQIDRTDERHHQLFVG